MSNSRYAGSQAVLVQYQRPVDEDMPVVVRDRDAKAIITRPRSGGQTELLELHGASGIQLPKLLADSGLTLVDAYYEERTTSNGRPYNLVTFLFSREKNPDSGRQDELAKDGLPLLAEYLAERWATVTVRELAAYDGSHKFNTIVFNGGVLDVEIAPDRLRTQEYEDFGLKRSWSKGKPKEHIAA